MSPRGAIWTPFLLLRNRKDWFLAAVHSGYLSFFPLFRSFIFSLFFPEVGTQTPRTNSFHVRRHQFICMTNYLSARRNELPGDTTLCPTCTTYHINEVTLGVTTAERDLGSSYSISYRVTNRCATSVQSQTGHWRL